MAVFVILALALAAVSAAVVVVAVLQLRTQVRRLAASAAGVRDRVAPLAEELQAEIAVTEVEADALQRSVERLQEARRGRRLRREGLRDGVRRSLRAR